MTDIHSKEIDELFTIILRMENVEQCYEFFEDLCTIKELKDMALRIQIAKKLKSGLNYQQVMQQINVSSATISRVKKCLDYGNGYQKFIEEEV